MTSAILVFYVPLDINSRATRMEQSLSQYGGKTWEVNWICELSRWELQVSGHATLVLLRAAMNA